MKIYSKKGNINYLRLASFKLLNRAVYLVAY